MTALALAFKKDSLLNYLDIMYVSMEVHFKLIENAW